MITLSNGDKWIIDDSEWKEAGIDYKEACKGNIPATDAREFIEKLIDESNDGGEYFLPRKLVDMNGSGYWNANFNPYKEVLGDTAVKAISNKWSVVYRMPWEDVIVVTVGDGYDAVTLLTRFKNIEEYMSAVSFKSGKEE